MSALPKNSSWASGSIDHTASAWVVRRDAGLTASEQVEFDCWRAADPRHAEALAWHEKAWEALDRPRRSGEGDYLMREYRRRAVRRRRQRIAAAAVAFGLLLGAGALWRQTEPKRAAEAALIVVPEYRKLPDGSVVELKRGAEIGVAFDERFRHVTLRKGEAHFQIAKNKDRPFIVHARGVDVRAVGTAFSVQLDSRQIEVLVTEGRVAVAPAAAATPPASAAPMPAVFDSGAIVDAGYRAVVLAPESGQTHAIPAVTPLTAAEIEQRLEWRRTHLEFTDTRLDEAVALVNRFAAGATTNKRIVIGDPNLAGIPITGFLCVDNIDVFVRLLEASAGIEAERSSDTITLHKAPARGVGMLRE